MDTYQNTVKSFLPSDTGFKDRLRALRIERGLTQRQLADLIKSTNNTVSNWEKGVSRPSMAVLESISRALEVCPISLLGDYSDQQIQEMRLKPSENLTALEKAILLFSEDIPGLPGEQVSFFAHGEGEFYGGYTKLNHSGRVLAISYILGLLQVPAFLDGDAGDVVVPLEAVRKKLARENTLRSRR
jgi:transcriptional regulator with XRE-family HTH domain